MIVTIMMISIRAGHWLSAPSGVAMYTELVRMTRLIITIMTPRSVRCSTVTCVSNDDNNDDSNNGVHQSRYRIIAWPGVVM